MVRVGVWQGGEFGGYTDLPDNCSIKTAAGHYESRGYICDFSNHVVIGLIKGDVRILIEERTYVACDTDFS